MKRRSASSAVKTYLALVLAFLYVPIVVMIALSFNAAGVPRRVDGLYAELVQELLQREDIIAALEVTLEVAVLATIVATISARWPPSACTHEEAASASLLTIVSNLPKTMPDIVTGVSLMLMFVFAKEDPGLFHHGDGAHRLRHALCGLCRDAEAQTDEQAHLRGGAGSGRHARLTALTHVICPRSSGHRHRRAAGVHHVAGRFHHQLFHHQSVGAEPVYADLFATKLGISPVYYALSSLMFVVLLVLLLIVNRRTAETKA